MSLENVLAAAGLTHLTDKLGSETLESCVAAFTEKGRAGYMTHLKASGVEKLSDRQKFATSVGKVAKDGVVAAAPTALDKAAARWTNVELAKEMEGTQLTVRPKELARLLAGALPGLGPSPTLPGEAPSAPKPEARMRLIVLYGTGHKASDLAAWQAASPPWLEIRVLELPGHGTRAAEGVWSVGTLRMDEAALSDEEICSSVESERTRLVDALADSVRPLLDSPYCLYGFSSGALLAYLVVLELQKRGWPMPFRLFAGGRGAPHCVWSPEVIRQYRTASEEEMEGLLHRGLGLKPIAMQEAVAANDLAGREAASLSGDGAAGDGANGGSGSGDGMAEAEVAARALALASVDVTDVSTAASVAAAHTDSSVAGEEALLLSERVARRNALWRAPLLTSAVCVGDEPANPADGPCFSDKTRKGADAAATIQHRTVAAARWKLRCPLVVFASTADRVWPLPLPARWVDLVGDPRLFRYVELPKVSHFVLMDHADVQKAVAAIMAAAAGAATYGTAGMP